MTIVNFQQCWAYATAKVACRLCGKVSNRKLKDYGTVNPFNTNDDGTVRTPAQVRSRAQERVIREAKRQEIAGRICRLCETTTPSDPVVQEK